MTRPPGALAARWLLLTNALVALFVGLPFAAPLLLAIGQPAAANLIYTVYRAVCHQWAFRSYFLLGPQATYGLDELHRLVGPDGAFATLGGPALGYKVAFCERDVAIYLAVLAAGLAYAALRDRLGPLGLVAYLLLIAPMALDGFTQLFGLRESTWELRVVTGSLFALSLVWVGFPYLERGFREIREQLEQRFARVAARQAAVT